MLNLILGEELLPFSVLSTTSTICELKYGRERRIKVHFKEEGRHPEMKNLDDSSSYMDQISEFVHVKSAGLRERAQQYKKVELFWPHPLLKVRNIRSLHLKVLLGLSIFCMDFSYFHFFFHKWNHSVDLTESCGR